MSFNWKTVGVIALFVGVILLIWWAVKSARTGKDVKTGVSNDKIQKAAESAGMPAPIAEQIAQAPDSEAAARRIGISPVLATAIANGVTLTTARTWKASNGPLPDANAGKEWCCYEYDSYGKCKVYQELPIGSDCNFNA